MKPDPQRALVVSKLSRILGPADAERVLNETLVGLGIGRIASSEDRLRVGQALVARGGALGTIGQAICAQARLHSRENAAERARTNAELGYAGAIVYASDDAIIASTLDGTIRTWNPGAERLYGYTVDEAIGRNIELVVTSDRRDQLAEILTRAREGHATERLDTAHQTRSGEQIHVLLSVLPLRDDQRRIMGASAIARDVTKERRAEDALRESEARKAAMLRGALDAILSIDHEGRVLDFNPAAEKLFGYSSADATGRMLDELIVPQRLREQHRRGLARYVQTGEGRVVGRRVRLPALRRDGSEFPAEISIVSHPETSPPIFTGFIRDLTEVERSEKELERLVAERTRELAEVNEELEAFSYSVAHDLRAPLRAIDGFSQALLEDYYDELDEQGKSFLRDVRDSAQEMGQLIDDLLTLSRVTRSELQPESVDLSGLARQRLAELQRQEPDRRVEVVVQDGLEATGDARLLRVLLDNLLGNAWKFTGNEPCARIEVGTLPDAQRGDRPVTYFVRDNGAGFDMEYADKLFGVFQRLHSTREFEGTGIGLATVKRIVRRHGGQVRGTGHVGRGATFYFTLERKCEA